MESFAALAPMVFPSNCKGGCVPPCDIAACCKGKGLTSCADCADMEACDKITAATKKAPKLRGNLRGIKAQGLRTWAEAQLKAAQADRRRVLVGAVEKALG
ncbi:MAG: DUF3795 domain-containing protein [Armatimonadetes bacterium]|nr:DUF3795 domain-containing protein [Armatimonadota bacterium]